MKTEIEKYNYETIKKSKEEYGIDKILGKHVLTHLQHFFNDTKQSNTNTNTNTKKKYVNNNNNNNNNNKKNNKNNKTRKR